MESTKDETSTNGFFKEMCEMFFSKQSWKDLWHGTICQIKDTHVISSVAEAKISDGDKCVVRTLCERCNSSLILTIDKSDPDMFWIRQDGGSLGAARMDTGLLFDKPGSYRVKDYKEEDVVDA